MSALKLLFEEMTHRKLTFALGVLAVTFAALLFTAAPTLIDAYEADTTRQLGAMEAQNKADLDKLADDTRKLMRDMGFNLMIVHEDTDMSDFWAKDFSTVDMPEDYVTKLAAARSITLVTHLVASLQQKIKWNERSVLLVGYLPETPQAHKAKAGKSPMGYVVPKGQVFLGFELAHGRKVGEKIDILGESFEIGRLIEEKGSKEDITLVVRLEDAQRILDKKGKVNQILALGCKCMGERLPKVRSQLEEVLPQTKITEFRSIAVARAEQREMVGDLAKKKEADFIADRKTMQGRIESFAAVATPLVIVAAAIWIGLLALGNVRERRNEIGILRALGSTTGTIGTLFLGRALIQGLIGGVIGFFVGSWIARSLGTSQLAVAGEHFEQSGQYATWTIGGAALVSAMAAYLPTLLAIVQDPADSLRES